MSGAPKGSRVGTRFGPYRLKRLIGAGGFGEVYEAEDTVKDRIVALKLLPEGVSKDPVLRKRMQREAHAAGRLQEPHVVPIHDYGDIDGLFYVDMRLIDGKDLHTLLTKEGPLPPARAVAIVRQVAAALDAAHSAEVLHRDVKPENILMTRDDFAYLVDFGLATAATDERLTQMGTMVGTFSYMAPERFRDKEVTYRADIYSLGCVLHECLTGSRPYRADSLEALISAHLTAPIPRPSTIRSGIPAALDHVIARAMAKKPEDRYASAGEFALAAVGALTASDQERAATILERSGEATEPKGADVVREPPTRPHPPTPTPPVSGPMPRVSGPEWTPPPRWLPSQPQASPRRNRTPWIVGGLAAAAVAVVVVVVLVATGAFTGGSGAITTTTTPSPPPTGYTAEDSTLLGYVSSAGYTRSICSAQHPPTNGAVTSLECGSVADGPDTARFWLYSDKSALDDAVTNLTSKETLQTCPDGTPSLGKWHYPGSPESAGLLACGSGGGEASVIWTYDAKYFLAMIRGPAINDLFTWWRKNA